MAKRTRHPKNKDLFQFREGGTYYTRVGGSDISLETADFARAVDNLAYQESQTKRFGAAAYRFTAASLFPKFLESKKRETRASTLALYENIWTKYLEPTIGKYRLADIDQRVWDRHCRKYPSVKDFQNHRNLVSHFLRWASGRGHIQSLPILRNPKHKRRSRKIIPPAHLRMIFQNARGSLLLFLSMALFQGMRRSEILKLSWDRVDFERFAIALRDEDVKTDEGREIPMNETVHGLLVQRMGEQQAARKRTAWVFPHEDRQGKYASLTGLMTAWRWCLLHSGLAAKVPSKARVGYKIMVQYTWHDLRATFEKYSHSTQEFTDTQKEKMVGADIDVQKRIYVSMDADDLRGLERVVSNQVPELAQIVGRKTIAQKVEGVKAVGKQRKLPRKAGSNV